MKRTGFAVIVACCSVLSSGCATKPRHPTLAELESAEIPYLDEIIDEVAVVRQRVFARMERDYEEALAAGHPDDRTLDFLVLSGGGAKGAFGAGFLVGWGDVTDHAFARPTFDVVTGVSTGSLIAPMAFIGTDEAYRVANETYRDPAPDLVKSRGVLAALLEGESLYTDKGLFKTICSSVGPRIPEIAAGAADDRTLLVASVNINQGQTKAWDLSAVSKEVQSGQVTSEEFCRRILSSASIPLVFPPQVIDGNVYVDGSTTTDILIAPDAVRGASELRQRWAQAHPGVPFTKVRFWVIANTPLFVRPISASDADFTVLGRSLDLAIQAGLLSQLKIGELYQDVLTLEGTRFEFRFVAMPDGWTEKGEGMFNKDDMVAMSDLGMKLGRDPKSWRSTVPNPLVPVERRDSLQRDVQGTRSRGGST